MIDVIGKSLLDATKILSSKGYKVEVIEYITDKQLIWDMMLVVRQSIIDNKASLVVTNFKVRI